MPATTPPITAPVPGKTATDPAIFKILDDGTVLYKTYRQAADAAKQLQAAKQGGDTAKKLSQVKYGERYLAQDGRVQAPYTLGNLAEFQFTGLIVVMVVLLGLSLICAAIGRLIVTLDRGRAASPAPVTEPVAVPGIHPGLTDQELVVLLTAAASEALGAPVRIGTFRSLTAKDLNWAAQGRRELQTHRLK